MGYQQAESDQNTNQERPKAKRSGLSDQAAGILGGPAASKKDDKGKPAKTSPPEKAASTPNGNRVETVRRGDKAQPVLEKPEITLSEADRKAIQDAASLIAERGTSLAITPFLMAEGNPRRESILRTISKIADANPGMPRAEAYGQAAQMISNEVAARNPNLHFVARPYSGDSDKAEEPKPRPKPKETKPEETTEERMMRAFVKGFTAGNMERKRDELILEAGRILADESTRKKADPVQVPQEPISGSQIFGVKFDIIDTKDRKAPKEGRIGVLYLPLKEWRYQLREGI